MLEIQKAKTKTNLGFASSKGFSDVIALGLKVIDKADVLHIIHCTTRIIAATLVKSKNKQIA